VASAVEPGRTLHPTDWAAACVASIAATENMSDLIKGIS
jgi:hypothetical protein